MVLRVLGARQTVVTEKVSCKSSDEKYSRVRRIQGDQEEELFPGDAEPASLKRGHTSSLRSAAA